MKYFLLALLLIGCDNKATPLNRPEYRVASGRYIKCNVLKYSSCGMMLDECEDGHKYMCQTNIEEVK